MADRESKFLEIALGQQAKVTCVEPMLGKQSIVLA
jgi:hypothetical protein